VLCMTVVCVAIVRITYYIYVLIFVLFKVLNALIRFRRQVQLD